MNTPHPALKHHSGPVTLLHLSAYDKAAPSAFMKNTTLPPAAGEAAQIADELIGVTKRLRDAVATIRPAPAFRAHIQNVVTGGAYLALLDEGGAVIARSPFQRDDADVEEMTKTYRMMERACNSYDTLVERQEADQRKIKALVEALEESNAVVRRLAPQVNNLPSERREIEGVLERGSAALALAKETTQS